MNDELQKQLAEVVRKSLDVAQKTGEFVIDQAPELLQEFYMWHLASATMGVVLGIILILVGRYFPYIWLFKEKQPYDVKFFGRYGDEGGFIAYVVFTISGICGLLSIGINTYKIVYISVAPKLYLIEYFLNINK